MDTQKVYRMLLGRVYPLYLAKITRKNRTKEELDTVISWLTGYSQQQLDKQVTGGANLEQFFVHAPRLNPNRTKITGVICGVRVEEIEDPIMRNVRYLDKLVDELAHGRDLQKILRA